MGVDTVTVHGDVSSLGEENKTRTDIFGQRSERLQATRQQKGDPEQQIKQKYASESLLKLKRYFKENRYQSKILSELPKTDSTAESQRITVPVTGWPQDHRPKSAFSTNVLPGSNQNEFKPGWLHSTFFKWGEI